MVNSIENSKGSFVFIGLLALLAGAASWYLDGWLVAVRVAIVVLVITGALFLALKRWRE